MPRRPSASSGSLHRTRSSIVWGKNDDSLLLEARRQGHSWNDIASQFRTPNTPSKSANACRKRYERLMRKLNDEWDESRLQLLAREYLRLRETTWAPLAAALDQPWTVVEAKNLAGEDVVMEESGSSIHSSTGESPRRAALGRYHDPSPAMGYSRGRSHEFPGEQPMPQPLAFEGPAMGYGPQQPPTPVSAGTTAHQYVTRWPVGETGMPTPVSAGPSTAGYTAPSLAYMQYGAPYHEGDAAAQHARYPIYGASTPGPASAFQSSQYATFAAQPKAGMPTPVSGSRATFEAAGPTARDRPSDRGRGRVSIASILAPEDPPPPASQ